MMWDRDAGLYKLDRLELNEYRNLPEEDRAMMREDWSYDGIHGTVDLDTGYIVPDAADDYGDRGQAAATTFEAQRARPPEVLEAEAFARQRGGPGVAQHAQAGAPGYGEGDTPGGLTQYGLQPRGHPRDQAAYRTPPDLSERTPHHAGLIPNTAEDLKRIATRPNWLRLVDSAAQRHRDAVVPLYSRRRQ